jgi:hypothetical protein
VDAAWISYPAPGGVKLAAAGPAAEFALLDLDSAARKVLS